MKRVRNVFVVLGIWVWALWFDALPLIRTGEDCSVYVCKQLLNGKFDCSDVNACMERNKTKNAQPGDGKPGKTRPK